MRTLVAALGLAVVLTTGGAVARQALLPSQGSLVAWRCPACGAGNAGDPEARPSAVCRACSGRYAWGDLDVRSAGQAWRR
jgi:uncharacterized protein (DUF983 family)